MLLFKWVEKQKKGDPCSHARDTTIKGNGKESAKTSALQREHSRGSLTRRAVTGGETQAGVSTSNGDGRGEATKEGSAACLSEASKELPGHVICGPIFAEEQGGETIGQDNPRGQPPKTEAPV